MKTVNCKHCNNDFETNGRVVKYCPECRKLKWKIWKKTRNWETSEKGKAYMKSYHVEYKDKLKKLVYDYYGWSCKCCNETLESMLTVDHVNNDGFLDRKLQISGARFYKKIINENYPSTYQILCMNCNWSKRINKGVCQHKI